MISRLGRFEIQAEIGHGGFGQVFRAFDPTINSVVAIKVLTANEDVNAFTRFRNEASAARKLVHPNIITIFEFGQDGNTPFMVMEYLDGEDLQHIIAAGCQLSLYQKIRIMVQVADGLYCAHRNGVLHRDVKPANIMVLRDGSVKIMDFGIARLMRDTSTRLTQQGSIVGTVLYMAPELFSEAGIEVDSLCDIWSYGVILYELLAGKNPFKTGVMQSEIYRIVTLEIPPIPDDACSPELRDIANKLLSRKREKRYQTLEDARFDLQPLLKNLEVIEVDRVLAGARRHLEGQRWAEALDAAREALRLDPNHRLARRFFDLAQENSQAALDRKAIDNFVWRATDLSQRGSLSEAIELLESAPKSARDDEKVRGLLQELHTIEQNRADAAKLVVEADKQFRLQHLTEAVDLISRATYLDSENRDAQQLRDRIQGEMQRLEDERAYLAEIRKVDGLIMIGDLTGALGLLTDTDLKFPGRTDTRSLVDNVRERIKERDRREELARWLARARDLTRNQQFDKIIEEGEPLLPSFPQDETLRGLIAFARKERDEQRRVEDVQRISEFAKQQSREEKFDRAVLELERGLQKYPNDPALTRLLRSTRDVQGTFLRDRAVQQALEQCNSLCGAEKNQEVLDYYAQLPSEIQSNRELRGLVSGIRQRRDLAARSARIGMARNDAEKLLGDRKFADAQKVVEAAISEVGTDKDLADLLQRIKDASVEDKERQRIESVIRDAGWFEDRGDFTTSLKIIGDELAQSPDSLRLKNEIERLLAKDKQIGKVTALEAAIRSALSRNAWLEADQKLKEATRLFPFENIFSQLAEELRRLKAEFIDQLVRDGRKLLEMGRVSDAEQFLVANLVDYRDVPEVISLARDVAAEKKRKASIAEVLQVAQERESANDLPGALNTLEKGLQQHRDDTSLKSAQRRVVDLIGVAKHREFIAAIEQALNRSDWEQALRLFDQARADYADDPALIPLQTRALDQRRAFLEGAAAAIRSNLKENRLEDARPLFQQTLARHPDLSITRELAAEIETAEAIYSKDRDKKAWIADNLKRAVLCEQEGDSARARSILQKALKKYPADPELDAALARLDAGDRGRALAARIAVIRKDLERGSWQDGIKHLEQTRSASPENTPELAALDLQLRELREREMQRGIGEGNANLKAGKLAEVDKILKKQLAPFTGEPPVQALADSLKEERSRAELIEIASSNTASRNFDKAESAIDELSARRPGDPELVRLRSAVAAAREQNRRETLRREGRAEGIKLIKNQKYPEAVVHFEYLLTQFQGDRQLQEDLETAKTGEQRRKAQSQARASSAPEKVAAKPLNHWLLGGITGAVVVGVSALIVLWPKPSDIKVTPDSLSFRYQPGTPVEAQKIIVTGSALADPEKETSWITVTRSNQAAGTTEFTVQVSPGMLGPGSYTTELRFQSKKTVRVALDVVAPPKQTDQASSTTASGSHVEVKPGYQVSPTVLTFPYARSGMPARTLVVTGSGDIPNPRSSQAWLTAVPGRRTQGRVEFSVRVLPDGLASGRKNAAELIFSPELRVPVEVNVPAEGLGVQPSSLAFPAGGSQQTITVTGPGAIPDPNLPERDQWVRYTRRRDSPTGKAVFIVETSTTGLEPGRKYETDLSFSVQAKVHVELTVPAQKSLEITPTELQFTYDRVHAVAPRTIRSTGPSEIPDPKKDVPWLNVTRTATGANWAEFTVQVSVDGIPPGAKSGELVFTPERKVRVGIMVFDPPVKIPTLQGTTIWSGTLNSKDDLEIKGSTIVKGSGQLTGNRLQNAEITIGKLTGEVEAVALPSQLNNWTLHLRNDSNQPLHSIAIPWTVKGTAH